LISSFLPSILLGRYASIDSSDGAGMNMMDLKEQAWSKQVLEATAPNLASKLEPVVPGHTGLGAVNKYFVQEYGFAPGCRVVAWSGDNPNSVAGLGLRNPGDVGLSMGTSDTIFSIMDARHRVLSLPVKHSFGARGYCIGSQVCCRSEANTRVIYKHTFRGSPPSLSLSHLSLSVSLCLSLINCTFLLMLHDTEGRDLIPWA
jgi:sugar (pentulose or hexulose) kinase